MDADTPKTVTPARMTKSSLNSFESSPHGAQPAFSDSSHDLKPVKQCRIASEIEVMEVMESQQTIRAHDRNSSSGTSISTSTFNFDWKVNSSRLTKKGFSPFLKRTKQIGEVPSSSSSHDSLVRPTKDTSNYLSGSHSPKKPIIPSRKSWDMRNVFPSALSRGSTLNQVSFLTKDNKKRVGTSEEDARFLILRTKSGPRPVVKSKSDSTDTLDAATAIENQDTIKAIPNDSRKSPLRLKLAFTKDKTTGSAEPSSSMNLKGPFMSYSMRSPIPFFSPKRSKSASSKTLNGRPQFMKRSHSTTESSNDGYLDHSHTFIPPSSCSNPLISHRSPRVAVLSKHHASSQNPSTLQNRLESLRGPNLLQVYISSTRLATIAISELLLYWHLQPMSLISSYGIGMGAVYILLSLATLLVSWNVSNAKN